MSQMIKDQAIFDEATTGVKILEETLTDGSTVYNVVIRDLIIFHCADQLSAIELFHKIDEQIPCLIH
jgi:hypothetical protein